MKQGWHSLILLTLPLCTIGSLTFLNTVTAQQVTQQVTPDGTVSTTVTTPDGKNFTINDGTTRGGNLFHSFKEFSVPTGGSANFNNAANIQNIISRVTGTNASNIDGAIRALGKANLFLLNPNGIIFGPNASLNIGGSFLGSTANSFLFDNGFEFSATDPQAPPLLTINVPIGLRYRDNPGVIQVNGPGSGLPSEAKDGPREKFDSDVTGLKVEPGKTLALVGGKVSVEGGVLRSEGGRVEIGSFDSNQVVKILPQEQGFSLGYEGTPSFRDIEFSKKSFVNVTGDGGGSIAIIGKNINLNSESLLLSDTYRDKNGGEISIVGDSISFSNRSSALANTFGSGNGAQIKLDANNIKFQNFSGLNIQTWDKGKAGDVIINAKDSLEIKGGSAFTSVTTGSSTGNAGDINVTVNGLMTVTGGINTNSEGTGKAGTININANSLQIENSGISSKVLNAGQAGEIKFNVADSLTSKGSDITTDTSGTGNAGNINIKANSFRLENGKVFSEAQENSTGNAGEIKINVTGTLELPQGAGISTTTLGKGDAGTIDITAGSFVLKGSRVVSNSDQNSTGNAGKINITAGSFELEGGQGVSSQMGKNSIGEGGEIKINVTDSLTINNTNGIITNTSGRGNAGKINITAGSFRLEQAGVRSQALENSTGKAGEININVAGTLELPKFGGITTSTQGTGEAGKIDITANSFVLKGSEVSSNSEKNSTGNAGEINIRANSFLTESSGVFSKTEESSTGNGGKINISVADLFKLDATGVKTENLGNGNGGNIEINTNNLYLTNGSQVRASTSGKGNGGSVTVKATGNISADGQYIENGDKSGFYSTVESSGVGNAGEVNIRARSLSLTNEGTISTSNQGIGNAGNITVTTAKDIRLDNQASIDANTKGGEGNITLNSRDLFLRNNSKITTNAQSTANAGNIEINSPLIVTFPNENSDITANALSGSGGRVTIRTQGLFGIAPLSRKELEQRDPTQLDPKNLPTNDITAISQNNPNLSGTVNIITPDVDPTRGLFELSETVIDPAQQIAQNPCTKGFGSSFTIVGRGGIPTDPKKILSSDNVRVDLVKPVTTPNSITASVDRPSQKPPVKEIIPARGWIYNEKGEVLLVGYDPTKTGPQRQPQTPASSCAAVK
ncbi:filamentous hemagglutinin N-terminal domain-containing protein [Scytonema tolypothrichoides VB-61278]|nr:filamentous hemagglutinin N-terminal domain-containing protein [Scytonema tolypothrichoides VB-61278]